MFNIQFSTQNCIVSKIKKHKLESVKNRLTLILIESNRETINYLRLCSFRHI